MQPRSLEIGTTARADTSSHQLPARTAPYNQRTAGTTVQANHAERKLNHAILAMTTVALHDATTSRGATSINGKVSPSTSQRYPTLRTSCHLPNSTLRNEPRYRDPYSEPVARARRLPPPRQALSLLLTAESDEFRDEHRSPAPGFLLQPPTRARPGNNLHPSRLLPLTTIHYHPPPSTSVGVVGCITHHTSNVIITHHFPSPEASYIILLQQGANLPSKPSLTKARVSTRRPRVAIAFDALSPLGPGSILRIYWCFLLAGASRLC